MGTDELKRSFGGRVQALREGAGLTQEQLAERIDRSVDTVSNIERGANSTRIEIAGRIAEVLGVSLPELFEFGEVDPNRQRRRQINALAQALSQQDEATSTADRAFDVTVARWA
eukprot:gene10004-9810_t